MKRFGKSVAALTLALVMGASVASGQLGGTISANAYAQDGVSSFVAEGLTDLALYHTMGDPFFYYNTDVTPDGRANQFSGNLFLNFIGGGASGRGAGITLYYNSLDDSTSMFGDHVTTLYSSRIIDNKDGTYLFIDQHGGRQMFRDDGTGVLRNVNRDYMEISEEGYTIYVNGGGFIFDKDGRLVTRRRYSEATYERNRQNVFYKEDGLIDYVQSEDGETLVFEYLPYQRVEDARVRVLTLINTNTKAAKGIWGFTYDRDRNLSQIQYRDQQESYYDYDKMITYDSATHRISAVDNSQYTYVDATSGKLAQYKVLGTDGTVVDQKQYLYGNYQTIVMDKDGNMTLKTFDQDGNLIS